MVTRKWRGISFASFEIFLGRPKSFEVVRNRLEIFRNRSKSFEIARKTFSHKRNADFRIGETHGLPGKPPISRLFRTCENFVTPFRAISRDFARSPKISKNFEPVSNCISHTFCQTFRRQLSRHFPTRAQNSGSKFSAKCRSI